MRSVKAKLEPLMTLTVIANLKTPFVIVARVLNFAVVRSCQPWAEPRKCRVCLSLTLEPYHS